MSHILRTFYAVILNDLLLMDQLETSDLKLESMVFNLSTINRQVVAMHR